MYDFQHLLSFRATYNVLQINYVISVQNTHAKMQGAQGMWGQELFLWAEVRFTSGQLKPAAVTHGNGEADSVEPSKSGFSFWVFTEPEKFAALPFDIVQLTGPWLF